MDGLFKFCLIEYKKNEKSQQRRKLSIKLEQIVFWMAILVASDLNCIPFALLHHSVELVKPIFRFLLLV